MLGDHRTRQMSMSIFSSRNCTCLTVKMLKRLTKPLCGCQRRKLVFSLLSQHGRSMSTTRRVQQEDIPLYDVVVSGGGMVGAAMAGALGHHPMFEGKKIVLLEAGPKKEYKMTAKFSSRTCALSPATKRLLEEFGAWEHITNRRYQPVKRMQVWDGSSDAMIVFQHDDMTDNLAYLVENDIILAAIMKQVEAASERVEVRYNCKVVSYDLPDGRAECGTQQQWAAINLQDGGAITTKLLIGADGIKSLVRETAKIKTLSWNYDQMAVVATLKLSEPTENNVAWQRFLTTGPVALLPVSNEYSCLVWSTTHEDARRLLKLEPEVFIDAVNNAFWSSDHKDSIADYVGRAFDNALVLLGLEGSSSQQLPPTITGVDIESRAAFPLGLAHASNYVKPRLALIGDAAHRVHPMAGQGVNLGFGDVAALSRILAEAVHNGSDLGSLGHLLEYETERQRDVVPKMATIDGLYRLYTTSWSPVVLLRTLGLQATNALKPVKDQLILGAIN